MSLGRHEPAPLGPKYHTPLASEALVTKGSGWVKPCTAGLGPVPPATSSALSKNAGRTPGTN
eukprot:4423948-Alexandrium_andersonii.AAC.1